MKLTRKQLTNIFFVIGVVAVVVMLFTFEVSFVELWHYLCDAGWWLAPIVGVWIIIYGMNALAWGWIVNSIKEVHQHIGWGRILKLTISGYALNYSTPVAGLGGEPYRIMELSPFVGNQRATSSVILYVMTHILAHFLFWLSGLAIYVWMVTSGIVAFHPATTMLTSVTLLLVGFVVLVLAIGYRNGLVLRLMRGLCRLPGLRRWGQKMLKRHKEALENVDSQIVMLHQQDKRTFYCSLAIELLGRYVQSLEIMFMLILFQCDSAGLGVMFLQSVFIITVATIMSNVLGFLPMQLGGQEGGFVLAIAMLGMQPSLGIFICIICRVREIVWIVAGLLLMKIKQ